MVAYVKMLKTISSIIYVIQEPMIELTSNFVVEELTVNFFRDKML